MYKCKDCKEVFDFPEIKRPDSGMAHARDIYGRLEIEPVFFCPACMSHKIELKEAG